MHCLSAVCGPADCGRDTIRLFLPNISQSPSLTTRVGTVLPFSVFFGFRVFALFIRVLGRVFGPDLLRVKSLYQLPGKNQGSLDYTI